MMSVRKRGSSRSLLGVCCAVLVMSATLVAAPVAGAVLGTSTVPDAPWICGGEGNSGAVGTLSGSWPPDQNVNKYAAVWVSSGATVSFDPYGTITPQSYFGTWRAEQINWVRLLEVDGVTQRSGLSESSLVVRGGANITPESISNGIGMHPCGIEGFSAESRAGATLDDLATWIPNNQIGVTTVGLVRAAGGEVSPTSGRSPTHATVSGLDPVVASTLLSPSRPNPVPKAERMVFG